MTRFYATRDLRVVIELSDAEVMAFDEIDDDSIEVWSYCGHPEEIRIRVEPMRRIGFLELPHHYYGHTYTGSSLDLLEDLEKGLYGDGFGRERVRVIY